MERISNSFQGLLEINIQKAFMVFWTEKKNGIYR